MFRPKNSKNVHSNRGTRYTRGQETAQCVLDPPEPGQRTLRSVVQVEGEEYNSEIVSSSLQSLGSSRLLSNKATCFFFSQILINSSSKNHLKMLTSTVVLLLLSVTTSVATSSSISGIRGKNRDLTEECGAFGTCNERSYCTDSGCQCKDGFKDPPYCQDRNECLETPSPCDFDGAVCVDEDPHLDGSPGGKYHCACNLKEGWVDGPDEPNDFGQTSCMRADQQHCPPSLDSLAADSFCETPASVNQSCSYKEECWYVIF